MGKYDIIYVICPAFVKTGGPECLHQLVNSINSQGGKSKIVYVKHGNLPIKINPQYEKYVNGFIDVDSIDCNNEKNLLIVPETLVQYLLLFKNKPIKKGIWWLSVDFYRSLASFKYQVNKDGFLKTIYHLRRTIGAKNSIKEAEYHYFQSYYAKDWLEKRGFNKDGLCYLTDYINDQYMEKHINEKRDNIIIYNPKKGYDKIQYLRSMIKEYEWIPIENMDRDEIIGLMNKAKLYLDFGNHPGKDKMPREAAISGCCIITGREGSANFIEDVNISNRYKFNDVRKDFDSIRSCISEVMLNYCILNKDFEEYRVSISKEKETFSKSVREYFVE
ncbi:MAG: hypothetical protein K6B72_02930 [Lachnospiraceae bacterium]|nr:hypothetical protein [Lachnospiraceae bacterium]